MADYEHIFANKQVLRKKIARQKELYTHTQLADDSKQIINNLEQLKAFQNAKTIFMYHSMPDEVNTHDLIRKYSGEKKILLPVVTPQKLLLRLYISDNKLHLSDYGIYEPTGDDFYEFNEIDLVVVPGVAFDRNMNRMGYGKAYYDNILLKTDALKVAVCFDFQLFDYIPHTDRDVKMDLIVCQKGIIL